MLKNGVSAPDEIKFVVENYVAENIPNIGDLDGLLSGRFLVSLVKTRRPDGIMLFDLSLDGAIDVNIRLMLRRIYLLGTIKAQEQYLEIIWDKEIKRYGRRTTVLKS